MSTWNAKRLSLPSRKCLTCWLGPHCLVFRETSASVCVPVTHSEAHHELRFWAHGGNVAENVGTVFAACISFFWHCPGSVHMKIVNILLPINTLACHFAATPKEYAVTFSAIKSAVLFKIEKNGQYLSNCCIKRVHYSQFSFLQQPLQ